MGSEGPEREEEDFGAVAVAARGNLETPTKGLRWAEREAILGVEEAGMEEEVDGSIAAMAPGGVLLAGTLCFESSSGRA